MNPLTQPTQPARPGNIGRCPQRCIGTWVKAVSVAFVLPSLLTRICVGADLHAHRDWIVAAGMMRCAGPANRPASTFLSFAINTIQTCSSGPSRGEHGRSLVYGLRSQVHASRPIARPDLLSTDRVSAHAKAGLATSQTKKRSRLLCKSIEGPSRLGPKKPRLLALVPNCEPQIHAEQSFKPADSQRHSTYCKE